MLGCASDGEPLAEAVSRHFDVHLFFFFNWVKFAGVLLAQEITILAAFVFHDFWQWLFSADVELEAEVTRHDEVTPLVEVAYRQVTQVILVQILLERLVLEEDFDSREPRKIEFKLG
jgi:hypothetical protein